MSEHTQSGHVVRLWLDRVRFVAALGLVWGSLHYVCEAAALPRGMNRPLVVTGAEQWVFATALTGVLLLLGVYVAAFVAGARRGAVAPLIAGLALALWSWPAGTMDDWLKLKLLARDASAAPAYWRLIGEYFFLFVCIIGATVLGELAGLGGAVTDAAKRKSALRKALGLDLSPAEIRKALLAMLLTAVIAGVLLLYLTGPRIAGTRRGQVYFAIAAAFLVGVLIARKVVQSEHPLGYCLAPFLVGVFGLVLAGFNPALPEPYAKINIIPASGLVRALPIELIGVATVTVIWALRPAHSSSASTKAG